MLYEKLLELHLKHVDTPDEPRFPRPSFKALSPSSHTLGSGIRVLWLAKLWPAVRSQEMR